MHGVEHGTMVSTFALQQEWFEMLLGQGTWQGDLTTVVSVGEHYFYNCTISRINARIKVMWDGKHPLSQSTKILLIIFFLTKGHVHILSLFT